MFAVLVIFLSLSCLPRGAPGRNANIENSLKHRVFYDEFAWVAFLRQVQREQISEHRHTQNYKTNTCKNSPRDVSKNLQKTSILAPKMAPKSFQNRSRKPVGGRWRHKTHPRRSQEQQTRPKRPQEQAKSAPRAPGSDFQGDHFPGRRLPPARAGPPGGVGEGL